MKLNLDGALYHRSCAKCAECGNVTTLMYIFLKCIEGCQITLENFTNNRLNTNLLCKTHYMKRFLESGGVYAKYKVTPAFEDVIRSMWKKQKEAEIAFRAEQERIKDEERRRKKQQEKESKQVVVTDSHGRKIDIDNIIEELHSNGASQEISGSTGHGTDVKSEIFLSGQDTIPKDEKPYRTLSTVKEFDM